MTADLSLKPVIWVGSSRRDLRGFPGPVQDHMGYALYIAQRGGKHRDAKTLSGFGGAGMVEVVKDFRGDPCTPCAMPERCTSFTLSRRNRKLDARPPGTWNW